MKKVLTLFLLISVFSACDCDKDPAATTSTPTILFTISRTPAAFKYPDIWFVVWADDGTVLDYKKFVDGQTLTLSTNEIITNNKVTLGHFRYYKSGSQDKALISIITDLEVGKEIVYDAPSQQINTAGTFKLEVDTLGTLAFTVSSKYGESNAGEDMHGDQLSDIDVPEGSKKFVVTLDELPNLYSMIDNVDVNSDIYLRPWDFKPYENEVSFNLPSDYQSIIINFSGLESGQSLHDQGYVLNASPYLTYRASYTTGYFDGLTKFKTSLGSIMVTVVGSILVK